MAMKQANRLLNVLNSGKTAWGHWQTLPGTNVSRAIARSGVDWVLIDCEHGNIDDGAMHEAVSAIAACGVSPIVRIPDSQPWMVKRALDAGAHGILVPLLKTAEQVAAVVRAAKFPPLGERGFGSPFSPAVFDANLQANEYLQQANSSLLTIIQIETAEALANVDAIAAIPGVDVLFVGPFDLGNAIGRPITGNEYHPELHSAIEKVLEAAFTAKKKTGIYTNSGAQAGKVAKLGFDMVNVSADMVALQSHLGGELARAKGESEGAGPSGPYGK